MKKQLKNYTEDAVKYFMDRWFEDSDMCHCENCRLDVMALMLNELKPKYVVTDKGALFAQLDDFDFQYRTDFMTVMTQAVKVVNKNPRAYCLNNGKKT
ncbi:MAG: late competence development ComFB family protein [Oscillospiraceae bacterium]|nr:late competence development ComFB family protein [Oscillospiraceae bacterium]